MGLEGEGTVFLGDTNVSIGVSAVDTSYAGVLQNNGGLLEGASSLTKLGTGTRELLGASTYPDGTTLLEGTLLANNSSASVTGSGEINLAAGTLGGHGASGNNFAGDNIPSESVAARLGTALRFCLPVILIAAA